jgi:hypothetical protein
VLDSFRELRMTRGGGRDGAALQLFYNSFADD